MDIQEYINRLQAELKGLPTEKRDLIIEEISTHLDEGQADKTLGQDQNRQIDHLIKDMGNPQELGRRLKEIHYPKRWLEYLLIVIPAGLFFPFLILIPGILFNILGIEPEYHYSIFYWANRLDILPYIAFVLIALSVSKQQGRETSLIFWLTTLWLYIFNLCADGSRWNEASRNNQYLFWAIETIFWSLILFGLLFWLSKILMRKRDPQYFSLVSILFVMSLGNLITNYMTLSGADIGNYAPSNMGFIHGFYLPYLLAKWIWPAVFLFPKQRIFRWFALLIYAVPVVIVNLSIIPSQYPFLILLSVTPILLIAFYWMADVVDSRQKSRIIHSG